MNTSQPKTTDNEYGYKNREGFKKKYDRKTNIYPQVTGRRRCETKNGRKLLPQGVPQNHIRIV